MIERAKFENSSLGEFSNKWLNEKDQEEGFLKRLKNIEGKNEEQLKAIKDQGEIQTKILVKLKDLF